MQCRPVMDDAAGVLPFLVLHCKSSFETVLWAENQAANGAANALDMMETIMKINIDDYWRTKVESVSGLTGRLNLSAF